MRIFNLLFDWFKLRKLTDDHRLVYKLIKKNKEIYVAKLLEFTRKYGIGYHRLKRIVKDLEVVGLIKSRRVGRLKILRCK